MIRIVYIDDSPWERRRFEIALASGDDPYLRDASVTTLSEPPADLADLRQYDLVIIDQDLGARMRTGAEIAADLHSRGWRIPVILYTGMNLHALPPDLWMYLDGIAWKDEHADQRSAHSIRSAARLACRWLGRMQTEYRRGYQAGLADGLKGAPS